MTWLALEEATHCLAGPVRRTRLDGRAGVVVVTTPECAGVRLTVRQRAPAASRAMVGPLDAVMSVPPGRSSVRLFHVETALDGFDEKATSDLDWDIELDAPAPGPSPGVLAGADLWLRSVLPLIVDVDPTQLEARAGELVGRIGPVSLGRLSYRVLAPDLAPAAESLRRALMTMARLPASTAVIRSAVGRRNPIAALARMSDAELREVAERALAIDGTSTPPAVRFDVVRALAEWSGRFQAPSIELFGSVEPSIVGIRLAELPVSCRAVLSPDAIEFGVELRVGELLQGVLPIDWWGPGETGLVHGSMQLAQVHGGDPTDLAQLADAARWIGAFRTDLAGCSLVGGFRCVLPSALSPPDDRTALELLRRSAAVEHDGRSPLLDPGRSDAQLRLDRTLPSGGIAGGATLHLPALLTDAPGRSLRRLGALRDPSAWTDGDAFADAVGALLDPRPIGTMLFTLAAPPGYDPAIGAPPAPVLHPIDAAAQPGSLSLVELDGTLLGLGVRGRLAADSSSPGSRFGFDVAPKARWLNDVLGSAPATMRVELVPPPAGGSVRAVVEAFRTAIEGTDDLAAALAARLRQAIATALPDFEYPDAAAGKGPSGIAARLDEIRTAVAAGPGPAAELFADLVVDSMPGVRIEHDLELSELPLIGDLLRFDAGLRLEIDSLHRNRRTGDRTEGGIRLAVPRASLVFAGMRLRTPAFVIDVDVSGPVPLLSGRVGLSDRAFAHLGLKSTELVVDTAQRGQAVHIEAVLDPLSWSLPGGSLSIAGVGNKPLRVRVGINDASISVDEAELELDLGFVTANGTLHGGAPGSPAQLSLTGSWSVGVTLHEVRLTHPIDTTDALATWHNVTASLAGTGTKAVNLAADLVPKVADLVSVLPSGQLGKGTLTVDSLSATGFEAPLTLGVPAVATVAATVRYSDAGFEIDDAVVEVPALGISLTGPLVLSSAGVTAAGLGLISPGHVGFADLLDVTAGTWAIELSDGLAITPTSGLAARLLGAALPTSDQVVELAVSATGSVTLEYQSANWWSPPGLVDLFALQPQLRCVDGSLDIEGSWRALRMGNSWRRSGSADWSWSPSDPGLPLAGSLASLLGSSGILRNAAGANLRVVPGEGDWVLRLQGASARILWVTFSLPDAVIAPDGAVTFQVSDPEFSANGLTWTPNGALRVRGNLRQGDDSGQFWLPGGSVDATYSGLPSLSLPRLPASGWSSTSAPTGSSSTDAVGQWRDVPLIGSATQTEYRASAPEVTIQLRSSTPRLRVRVATGGLEFRQWVPDNPFTPGDDSHWATMSLTSPSQTYSLDSNGKLTTSITFPSSLTGAGDDDPTIAQLLD